MGSYLSVSGILPQPDSTVFYPALALGLLFSAFRVTLGVFRCVYR